MLTAGISTRTVHYMLISISWASLSLYLTREGQCSHSMVSGSLKRCSLHRWSLVFSVQGRWQMSWTTNTGAFYWWRVECAGVATCWDLLLVHKSNTITSCGSMIQHFSEPPECEKKSFPERTISQNNTGESHPEALQQKVQRTSEHLYFLSVKWYIIAVVMWRWPFLKTAAVFQNCFAV